MLIESGKLSYELVASLYKNASVVVFPSQYEGFGLPFLHAAQAGAHVVAFDSPVSREVVEAFGLRGMVTLCSNFSDLAAAVEGAPSSKHVVPSAQRSWSDVAQETAALIRSSLAQEINVDLLQERSEFFRGCNAVRAHVFHELHTVRGMYKILKNRLVRILSKIYKKITCIHSFFG